MDLKNKYVTEIIYTQKQIEDKILELSQWVNKTYENSNNLILIGLLKGSIPFLAQLIKNIDIDMELDFMTVSSYEGTLSSTGNLKIILDLAHDIKNKDVLIVEDIVDSGFTLSKIFTLLEEKKPSTLRVITLLDKPEGRKIPFKVDKFGFIVPNKFLVGYGLDVKEKFRNLPYIGVFDKTKLDDI